jgi:hypothetical protein
MADKTKNSNTKHMIIVRDEEFTLRRTQLEFDAPNYFTTYFYGDFAEADAGVTTLTLDRSPELFAIIVEYMSGYHILPLAQKALPRTMTTRTAMLNLVEDAAFYGLTRLHALLMAPAPPKIDFNWTGFSSRVITFEDVLKGNLPESVNYTTSGLCSFEGGSGKPVIIFARNMPIKCVISTDPLMLLLSFSALHSQTRRQPRARQIWSPRIQCRNRLLSSLTHARDESPARTPAVLRLRVRRHGPALPRCLRLPRIPPTHRRLSMPF